MKSMTGYAQGRFEFDNFSLNIAFKSLNHRFLDINFKGTGITPNLEKLIREIIKNEVFRGKIEVIFDLFLTDQTKYDIKFNENLLSKIFDELLYFKRRYNKEKLNLSIDSMLKIPMIFHIDYLTDEFSETDIQAIKDSIHKVFNDFLQHRTEEGQAICDNLMISIEKIESDLKTVSEIADELEESIFAKYKEKIAKYLKDFEIDERRVAQEAAVLAEKSSISEEIHRLETHTRRLKGLLRDKETDVKGREADFLSQEMYRETHTIASKSNSLELQTKILEIRREIEKIKQQVQNVE
jgi:uncharacterized protein (TIGR00255 family)